MALLDRVIPDAIILDVMMRDVDGCCCRARALRLTCVTSR